MVLHTIPYEYDHDKHPYNAELVSLHPSVINSRDIPLKYRSTRTVDARQLRGISKPDRVHRLDTPLRMTEMALERQINPKLEDFYGPKTE